MYTTKGIDIPNTIYANCTNTINGLITKETATLGNTYFQNLTQYSQLPYINQFFQTIYHAMHVSTATTIATEI